MKKQYFYLFTLTHKNGRVETREVALKPHLGLGNETDAYLEFHKTGKYSSIKSELLKKDVYK